MGEGAPHGSPQQRRRAQLVAGLAPHLGIVVPAVGRAGPLDQEGRKPRRHRQPLGCGRRDGIAAGELSPASTTTTAATASTTTTATASAIDNGGDLPLSGIQRCHLLA